jgi:hypothetical protein
MSTNDVCRGLALEFELVTSRDQGAFINRKSKFETNQKGRQACLTFQISCWMAKLPS